MARANRNGEEKASILVTTNELSDSQKEELTRQSMLLSNIAALGGRGMKEEDIVYEGDKLQLPEKFRGDLNSAISYLQVKKAEEDEPSTFSRTYNYRPWDGGYNAFNALKKAFGMVAGRTIWHWWGPERPEYINVPVSTTETERVPWGNFTVPLLENTNFEFTATRVKDYGDVFKVNVTAPARYRFHIDGLFKLIEEELKENSIYRGKAIDGRDEPQFIDLSGFDSRRVVYAEQVMADLEASLWSVLRYSQATVELGLPLKRAVLLTGKFGTGKTLAGFRTAVEATRVGWTFIMARPGRDDFTKVMQTAMLYQPAVVFMEDADTIANAENGEEISKVLDLFDGIQSKNTKIIAVLTTNYPERLHKGMMRPGRVDAIIEINDLDAAGIERLFRQLIGDRLDPATEFAPVVEACRGYVPAFIKEAADRAVRYALARAEGNIDGLTITTEDLVFASSGLRSQFDRMETAPEVTKADRLATAFTDIVKDATQSGIADVAAEHDSARADVWHRPRIEELQAEAARAGNHRR